MVRLHDKWQFSGFWCLVRCLPGAKHLVTSPYPRFRVDCVWPISRPKDLAEVKSRWIRVQVMLLNEFLNPRMEHEVGRIIKVNLLNCQLVGDHRVWIIRNPLRNPVVTCSGFEVPSLVIIGEKDPVCFASSVLCNQVTKALNPFTSSFDIW